MKTTAIPTTLSVLMLTVVLAGCGSPASSLASPSVVATASSTPVPTAAPTGAISGQLGFPSDFIPPVTIYAVNVADSRIFFSVDTLRYPPAVIAPGPQAMYTIVGVVPGTYNVFAYRNDDISNDRGGPGLHSQYLLKCVPPPATAICTDHSLLPVVVTSGQTAAGIDVKDWYYDALKTSYPPRP